MNDELNEYLANLTAVKDELNQSVREARELMKDLKGERKYWEEEKRVPLFEEVERKLGKELKESMDQLEPDLKEFVTKAEDRVIKRFEDLITLLIGKRKGMTYSIQDLIVARVLIEQLLEEKGIKPVSLRQYVKSTGKLPPGLGG